ncbi:MAG TPA: NAD(P)-dependent oxidoreductase [Mycobacteriales bacterium]|nr:NAD(P)-dependent oxidoreductase [Mycobacteriales bacterium]
MSRIAITGARGGVGTRISETAIAQGHSVIGIDRPDTMDRAVERAERVDLACDVTAYDELEDAVKGADALIHLAAFPSPGHRPVHETHNNNVVGSYNALSVAVSLGIDRVCLASSINAIGGVYSRAPRYDYFPVDEKHPTYNEDPYSLSKWICEQQADSFARRYEQMSIATIRLHWAVPDRDWVISRPPRNPEIEAKQLWGYTTFDAVSRACLQALTADFAGHECFYIVASQTTSTIPSEELARKYFPDVPVVGDLSGTAGFFDCSKAERILGWQHDR